MMTMKMLVVAIVITIVYLSFSTWRVFITKRQTKVTIVDIGYAVILMLFTGMITDIRIIILIGVLLMIWLAIIINKGSKNSTKK